MCISLARRLRWACPKGSVGCGCECPIVPQQQNFKQKVVALLRRFKVSEEVRATAVPVPGPQPRFCQVLPAPSLRPALSPPHTPSLHPWGFTHEQVVVPTPRGPPGSSRDPRRPPAVFLELHRDEQTRRKALLPWGCDHRFLWVFYESTFYSSLRFTVTSSGKCSHSVCPSPTHSLPTVNTPCVLTFLLLAFS